MSDSKRKDEVKGTTHAESSEPVDSQTEIKKRTLRHLGGTTWEDKSLLDWPESMSFLYTRLFSPLHFQMIIGCGLEMWVLTLLMKSSEKHLNSIPQFKK